MGMLSGSDDRPHLVFLLRRSVHLSVCLEHSTTPHKWPELDLKDGADRHYMEIVETMTQNQNKITNKTPHQLTDRQDKHDSKCHPRFYVGAERCTIHPCL